MAGSVTIQFLSGLPSDLPEQETAGPATCAAADDGLLEFVPLPGVAVLRVHDPLEPVELTEEAFIRRLREVGSQADARGDRLMVELSVHYDPEESLRLSGIEPAQGEIEPAWDAVVGTWDAWGQQSSRLGSRSGRGLYPWKTQCEVAARMVARDCAELVLGLDSEALVTGEMTELFYFSETRPGQGTRYWAEGRVLMGDADERGLLDVNGLSATVKVTLTFRPVASFESLRRSLLLD